MLKFTSRRPWMFFCPFFAVMLFSAVIIGCDSQPIAPADDDPIETKISGVAALNTMGARVEARTFHDGALIGTPTTTDQEGRYELRLKSFSGDLVIRVCGGVYVDMVAGTTTEVGDDCLHAIAADVEVCEHRQLHVNPFSELVHSYSGFRGMDGARALQEHMGRWTGNQDTMTRSSVFGEATKPVNGSNLNDQSMSYLMLGGLSRLASDLSERIGLQPGLRLSVIRLAKLLSEDISDGALDGSKAGKQIMLTDTCPLPSGLLRQEFAQAIRRFSDSDKNQSGLRSLSVIDALNEISMDSLPALGQAGSRLDCEPPAIVINGVIDNAVVAADTTMTCLARDVTGVAEVSMEVKDLVREDVFLRERSEVNRRDQGQAAVSSTLTMVGRLSGHYRLTCHTRDVWGNGQEQSLSFFVNQGDVLPEVWVDPPLVGSHDFASGMRTIQCGFDDPRVVEIRAQMQTPTTRIDFPPIRGRRAAGYSWDTREEIDGDYTITCLGWTEGHREPRVRSVDLRVKNHEMGRASGRVFPGARVSGMRISAFRWGRNGIEAQLSDTASPVNQENGRFELSLSNEYRGPVLIQASIDPSEEHPTMGSITSTGQSRELPRDFVLQILLEHYEPGQRFEGLAINGATTIAADIALTNQSFIRHLLPADNIRRSMSAIGRHISPRFPLDLSTTSVPDMTSSIAGRVHREESLLLGLFHGGIESVGATNGYENGGRRGLPDVLRSLREDLRAGAASRVTADRQTVGFGANGAFLLRSALATRTSDWLRNDRDGEPGRPVRNRTTIRLQEPLALSWLQHVSTSSSDEFDGHETTPFDVEGPSVRFECMNPEGELAACTQTFRDSLVVRIMAEDISGVDLTEVFFDQEQLRERMGGTASVSTFDVRTEPNFAGEKVLRVRSRDGLGNVSESRLSLSFDSLPVGISFGALEHRTNQNQMFSLPVQLSKESVRMFISGEKLDIDNRRVEEYLHVFLPSRDLDVPLMTGLGDGAYRFRVVAEDALGNQGEENVRVLVKTERLGIDIYPNSCRQRGEDDRNRRMTFGSVDHVRVYDVDLDPYHWGQTWPGWPVWRIQALRSGNDITHAVEDSVRGWFRYSLSSEGRRMEGTWRELQPPPGDPNRLRFEVNYITMMESLYDKDKENLHSDENVIYHARPAAEHRIDLKISDEYGNVTEKSWEFRLTIDVPPLYVWIGRAGMNTAEDWRGDARTALSEGSDSGLLAHLSWFGGEAEDSNVRGHHVSMLPRLPPVRVRMDDVLQVWRVEWDHHSHDRVMQVANLGNGEESLVVGRGTRDIPLATIGTWEGPHGYESFFSSLGKESCSLSRRVWTPMMDRLIDPHGWRDGHHGQGSWSWQVRVDGTLRDQKIPKIRACPERSMVAPHAPSAPNSVIKSAFWSTNVDRTG